MSLKVPCKYCGKKISLRKMPHGHFVAFEIWTKTQHRCQQPHTQQNNIHAVSMNNIGGDTSIGDLIFRVISTTPGKKTRQIASLITRKYGIQVDRSEVNRWLYGDLKSKVYQNGFYRWFPESYERTEQNIASQSKPENISAANIQGDNTKKASQKWLWIVIVILVLIIFVLLRSKS